MPLPNDTHCSFGVPYAQACEQCSKRKAAIGAPNRHKPGASGYNITCPRCRHRHPANVTCEQAGRQAQLGRMAREKAKELETVRNYTSAVEDYNTAVQVIDEKFGVGTADAILNLLVRWNTLGEINGR